MPYTKEELKLFNNMLDDKISSQTRAIAYNVFEKLGTLKIDEFSNQAIEAISEYPDSAYRQSLIDLVAFNSSRNY